MRNRDDLHQNRDHPYHGDDKLSPPVRVLPWTHNLIILAQSKRPEEREFYPRMAVQERWGKRELERQFRLGAFEKAALAPAKLSPAVREIHGEAASEVFNGTYTVELRKRAKETFDRMSAFDPSTF